MDFEHVNSHLDYFVISPMDVLDGFKLNSYYLNIILSNTLFRPTLLHPYYSGYSQKSTP